MGGEDNSSLRFALLCLRVGVLTPERVESALAKSRESRGTKSIGEVLVEEGALTPEMNRQLQDMLEEHLSMNQGDEQASHDSLADFLSLEMDLEQLIGPGEKTIEYEAPTSGGFGRIPLDPNVLRGAGEASRFVPIEKYRQGGMGEVLRARDTQLDRVVALKQIRSYGRHDEHYRERFVFEGLVTGNLEHPGIVPVYAMGLNAESTPYYVMRFVEGKTLTEAVDAVHDDHGAHAVSRGCADFRGLVRRFAQACYAVEYAHSRGVLHRDIKPQNIMLGAHQETLVVDWGLACSLKNPDGSAGGARPLSSEGIVHLRDETGLRAAVGTPSYMSPEQAEGDLEEVREPSDVFNLGATLYQIITNKAPYRADDRDTTIENARKCIAPKPRALSSRVPKSLEAIVLKSMAKRPGDRYASPRELAEDVERWLADERVLAAPDPLPDRAARWVRKHKGLAASLVGSLLIVVMVAVAAAAVINEQKKRERAAKAQAQEWFADAQESVDVLLTGFAEAARNAPHLTELRRELLLEARESYAGFLEDIEQGGLRTGRDGDFQIKLEHGRTLIRLADIEHELDELTPAKDRLLKAVAQLEELADEHPDKSAPVLSLANAENRLGLSLAALGKREKAIDAAGRSIQACESLIEEDRSATEARAILQAALTNKAQFLTQGHELARARATLGRALRHYDGVGGEIADAPDTFAAKSRLKLALGQVSVLEGDSSKAIELYSDALSAAGAARQSEAGNVAHSVLIVDCLIHRAAAARNLGLIRQAYDDYWLVVDSFDPLQGSSLCERAWVARSNLAQLFLENGDPAEAQFLVKDASETFEQLASLHPDAARFQWLACVAHDVFAQAHLVGGDSARALDHARRAREIAVACGGRESADGGWHHLLGLAESHRGQILATLGRTNEAEQAFLAARDSFAHRQGSGVVPLAERYAAAAIAARMGAFYQGADRTADAHDLYQKAAEGFRSLAEESRDPHHHFEAAWFFLTCPDETIRDAAMAEPSASLAYRASPKNPRFATAMALCRLRSNDVEGAEDAVGADFSESIGAEGRLGLLRAMIHAARGRTDQATKEYSGAREWCESNAPGDAEMSALQSVCETELSLQESDPTAHAEE